jgi:hypothetical protein
LPIGKKMLRRSVYFSLSLIFCLGLGSCTGQGANLCGPELVEAYDNAAKNFKHSLEASTSGRRLASFEAHEAYQEKLTPEESKELIDWSDRRLREAQDLMDTLRKIEMKSTTRTQLRHKLNDLANALGSLTAYAPHAKAAKILHVLEDVDSRAKAIHTLACGPKS